MSSPETISDVTAEMRRMMPNACGDWADRIERAARPNADSLRDYFAGQALTGLRAFQDGAVPGEDFAEQAQIAAEWSYEIADAMLAARGDA